MRSLTDLWNDRGECHESDHDAWKTHNPDDEYLGEPEAHITRWCKRCEARPDTCLGLCYRCFSVERGTP